MIPTIWYSGKGKTIERVKTSVVPWSPGGAKEIWTDRAQGILKAMKTIMADTCHSTEGVTQRMNPKANYRLWVMMYNNISLYNITCTTLIQDVNNTGTVFGEKGGIWELSVLSIQVLYKHWLLQKIKSNN